MVELYEAYAEYNDEATRLEELVRRAARAVEYAGDLDFESPWPRVSFHDAIRQQTGIDLSAHREVESLSAAIAERGLEMGTKDSTWFPLAAGRLSKLGGR